jgi:pimeloyl-ACP methyl ester carboxylesterase
MPDVEYVFEEVERTVSVTEGNPDLPMVLLLHGAMGTIRDMIAPADGPDNNYDHLAPLGGEIAVGQRAYPGIGVWSCCSLDDKKEVRSWRDVLVLHKFSTAAYSQVDNGGFLERPARELVEVVRALGRAYPKQRFVVLAHSRGGLLTRLFLKSFPRDAARVTTVITLHSPHEGSSIANLANTVRELVEALQDVFGDVVVDALGWLLEMTDRDAWRELAVGSQFLTDLAANEQAMPGVAYHTFGGVSVRLTRIRSWVYTLESAIPKWQWPPYDHSRVEIEVPGASPAADSLPNVIEELSEGRGDLLTADSRTRLPFAVGHQTNPINHAEALWDPILQAQVLRILGVDVPVDERPEVPSFWN